MCCNPLFHLASPVSSIPMMPQFLVSGSGTEDKEILQAHSAWEKASAPVMISHGAANSSAGTTVTL